jgi:hypothetical protein
MIRGVSRTGMDCEIARKYGTSPSGVNTDIQVPFDWRLMDSEGEMAYGT